MIAENLLRQIAEFGFELKIEGESCALAPLVPDAIMPKQVLGEIKRQKSKLLALCVCAECGRTCPTLQEIDVMAHNYALCDRGSCQFRRDLKPERFPPAKPDSRSEPKAKKAKPAEDVRPGLFDHNEDQ